MLCIVGVRKGMFLTSVNGTVIASYARENKLSNFDAAVDLIRSSHKQMLSLSLVVSAPVI